MRKVVIACVVTGLATVVYFAIPSDQRFTFNSRFDFKVDKPPAYYQAAELALESWLLERGFARTPADQPAIHTFPHVPGSLSVKFERPTRSNPLVVRIVRDFPSGNLGCRFDWLYDGAGWFRPPEVKEAEALGDDLWSWFEAYKLRNP